MSTDLEDEAQRATEMLSRRTVRQVWRRRAGEVGIEFTDGVRLFVDSHGGEVELSITGT